MTQLQKQKENKSGLMEDMLSFISYTPSRESDILAFMEQYQKSECERRPEILENLRACMDGKKYPNPYAANYRYTPEDVAQVGCVLDEYIDSLEAAKGNQIVIGECARDAVCQLNALNEASDNRLIDTWRRERLCNFINSAAELAGLVQESDLTQQHRMW